MTTVGHSLLGIAVGVAVVPTRWTTAKKLALVSLFVGLANVPDWPLPLWGHSRYDVSHSILTNALLIGLACGGMLLWRRGRDYMGGAVVIVSAGVAWFSHILLDSLYNHGRGVAAFWPISQARLNLAVPWFETLSPGDFFAQNAGRIFLTEATFFGGLALLSVAVRRALLRQRER